MARPPRSASNPARSAAAKARRASARARGPLSPARTGGAPDFRISVLEVRGRPGRILLDIETNPALTPFENDHLINVVTEYLWEIGRESGICSGYARGERHRADLGAFQVVRRGEKA
jgi:hypothetical protein